MSIFENMSIFGLFTREYIVYILSPSAFLTFDLFIILQIYTKQDFSRYTSDPILTLFFFVLSTLLMTTIYQFSIALIANTFIEPIFMQICKPLAKAEKISVNEKYNEDKKNEYCYLHQFFLMMIVPTLLFGWYFPSLINCNNFHSYYRWIYGPACILLLLSLLSFYLWITNPSKKAKI